MSSQALLKMSSMKPNNDEQLENKKNFKSGRFRILGYSELVYIGNGLDYRNDFNIIKKEFKAYIIFMVSITNPMERYSLKFYPLETENYHKSDIETYWYFDINKNFSDKDILHKALDNMVLIVISDKKDINDIPIYADDYANCKTSWFNYVVPILALNCSDCKTDWFHYEKFTNRGRHPSGHFAINKRYFN